MPKQMADLPSTMTVVDVYDTAASIGKEFERIIDTFGAEAVTELMPKVITVLEQLEILASNAQKENAEIAELKVAVERLTAEKVAKTEERHKYEQELEQIEESWRKESRELVDTVSRLQEDNRRLRAAVNQQQTSNDQFQKAEEEADNKMQNELKELKDLVHMQRSEMRGVQRELASKAVDMEALECQLEQEIKHKAQMQRELQLAQTQIHNLAEEHQNKDEMQSQIERMAKLNAEYRRKSTLTQQRAQSLIQEKADLQAQLHDKEHQILSIKSHMNAESIESPASPKSDDDIGRLTEKLMGEGKMVIDLEDPDRPRFSLTELKEVLTERNELKTKLIEVEEELQHFKPVEMQRQEEEEEDPPVQGPMPQEPYEKLHPGRKGSSGIRKFFTFLLSPGKKPPRNIPLQNMANN